MLGIRSRLLRAADAAVLWRLGLIAIAPGEPPQLVAADPEEFWAASRVGEPETVVAQPARGHDSAGARWLDLRAPSRGPGEHAGARELHARAVIHPDAQAPFVLVLHGYAVPHPWYEERLMRFLLRRGLSAARLELPFHLRRRVPRSGPGSGFFSSDIERTAAVLRQAVEDAAAVVAWARRELGPTAGVLGVSLGGLVAGLLAARVRLQSAVLVTPASDLVEVIVERAPRRIRRRLDLVDGRGGPWAADTLTAHRLLDAALAPLVLRRLIPRTPGNRMTIVAAEYDVIVGAEPVRALAAAWGAECWVYPRGHITVLSARGLVPRLAERLARDLHEARAMAAAG